VGRVLGMSIFEISPNPRKRELQSLRPFKNGFALYKQLCVGGPFVSKIGFRLNLISSTGVPFLNLM
jgi:hypothetical protein